MITTITDQFTDEFFEDIIVQDKSVQEEWNDPVSLTDKQKILLLVHGVRWNDMVHEHPNTVARKRYIDAILKQSEDFTKKKGRICPGHFHDILDLLKKRFTFKSPAFPIETDAQARDFYDRVRDMFNLGPSYYDMCRCYALGVPFERIVPLSQEGAEKLRQKVEERFREATQDKSKGSTSKAAEDSQDPSQSLPVPKITSNADHTNAEGGIQITATPAKRAKRTARY